MTIELILMTDREITKLNRQWFGRNYPTDVIAFDHGEVYVSVDTARRQARKRRVSFEQELLRLAIHGTAHIEGYEDTNVRDFCKMREREWEILIEAL